MKIFMTMQNYKKMSYYRTVVCFIFRNFAQNNQRNVMSRVTIKDKTFEVSITEEEIQQRVRAVADRINHDLQGKNPIIQLLQG